MKQLLITNVDPNSYQLQIVEPLSLERQDMIDNILAFLWCCVPCIALDYIADELGVDTSDLDAVFRKSAERIGAVEKRED